MDACASRRSGRVVGIAVRPEAGAPMRVVPEADARAGGWLGGDHGGSARRGVTLLALESWADATAAVGADLPWSARRANVCVAGLGGLLPLVGRRVRVGDLLLEILDETRPCHVMDETHPGLRAALAPAGRGGVYGRVLEGGSVRAGDAVEVLDADEGGR